jgi:hypothetical protein
MKRSERRRLITGAASLVGWALGGGIGVALGGIWGGIIGGITGVVLPWVFEALPNQVNRIPILGRALRKRALVTEIKRKLELEFGASAPSDSHAALELLKGEARAIAATPEFNVPGTVRMVQPPPDPQPAAASREICIELLRQVSPIRVVCPAICPSVVSVFKALDLQFPAGVKIQIDFTPENSGEITKRYASERWHFCAMSRLAILATDRYIDKMLLQVAPLYSVSQYMLCRPVWRRTDQARCVLMVRDSPSEAQFWAQQDKHLGAKPDYVRQTEIIGTAEGLKDNEYLIIWEPAASWIANEYDLELLKDTEFKFLISLLVNAEWANQYGDQIRAFYSMFRQKWDAGAQNRGNMLRLLTSRPLPRIDSYQAASLIL